MALGVQLQVAQLGLVTVFGDLEQVPGGFADAAVLGRGGGAEAHPSVVVEQQVGPVLRQFGQGAQALLQVGLELSRLARGLEQAFQVQAVLPRLGLGLPLAAPGGYLLGLEVGHGAQFLEGADAYRRFLAVG